MNTLLTHAYYLQEDEKEQQIMKPYAPLGMLYISAYLDEKGKSNKVLDSTFLKSEEHRRLIKAYEPHLIGLYCNLMTKPALVRLIEFIRKDPELSETKIALGGPDVTYNIRDYLSCGADFAIIGEGEQTFYELALAVEAGHSDYTNIDGLAFLNDGEVIKTTPRPKLKDLSELPVPARSSIDMQQYLDTWKKHHGKSMISVSTQRGCPYTCKWCSTAVYGQSYRRRPPEKVVDELEQIQLDYNPDAIWFVDDVFTVSHKWLEAFRDEVKRRKLDLPFECITRADRMNEGVIRILKEAGCFRVWIGAESGSQDILDAMDRRVDANYVRDMIKMAGKHGIETGTFIMLGYPGETRADIEATINHLKESDPDYFTITVAYPIKGTDLFNQVEETLTENINWKSQTDRERDFKRTYSRKYYDYAVRKVVHEVHLNKWRKSANKNLLEGLNRFVKASLMNALMAITR